MHAGTSCWQCEKPAEHNLFCEYCNSLQRPATDYYAFFGIPKKLKLDAAELERRYYQLSKMLHPDRYLRHAPRERDYSLEATAILNDGFRVLRDPALRAEYILRESGFDVGEQRTKDVPPELLEEVFELNLAVEELRGGDASVRPQLEEARAKFAAMRDQIDRELDGLFEQWDRTHKPDLLAQVRGVLNRRKYVSNLIGEVEKELAA